MLFYYIMETNIEQKIKEDLINKEFKDWDKTSINFLISIFEFEKYNNIYNVNLLLLNNYIIWYKKTYNNENKENMYKIENLEYIYCLINNQIYYNLTDDYIKVLNNIEDNPYYFYILNKIKYIYDVSYKNIGFVILLLIIIIKYIISFFKNKENNDKRYIFELKIPIPNDLINNPLIKYFLENKFF